MPLADGRRRLGDFGEAAAAAYLVRQDYTILARKWRCQMGEIDLIAQQGTQVVFVEVRTRRSAARGLAEESITPTKQRRLIALAHTYFETQDITDELPWRIDVIAVIVDTSGRVAHLEHISDAIEQE